MMIGSAGAGKSSLGNTLCGKQGIFPVGGNLESVTTET